MHTELVKSMRKRSSVQSLPIPVSDFKSNFQRILQLCDTIFPILNHKPLVLALKWLQPCAHRWYRKLARQIQFLE